MSNNYQWYPGHMTKAKRQMQEDIKLVDLVIELLDARLPYSSRNPDIDALSRGKSRLVLLCKADLADEETNRQWLDYFKSKDILAVKLDARNRGDMKRIDPFVQKACREKLERNKSRGIIGRPVRAMVAGIPNVGKSTFINSYAGKACAKTGNRPGVTKGKQWIKLSKTLELLDTPGILWPRFDDPEVGKRLAFIGSMNDQILELTELAMDLGAFLAERYPGAAESFYGLDGGVTDPDGSGADISQAPDEADKADLAGGDIPDSLKLLYAIADARRALAKGGAPDIEKASAMLLDDFRSGRLGRISLERPVDI